MASQQAMIAETIRAMKKALKRKAYESDSDDEIDKNGNRGQKLKKRARYVREGQLAPPSGPEVYKEAVNHAGYQRAIISRNPPLLDSDGDEIDSDDEERMQEALESAAQFNPYASIQLENILAPLTAVTDLPSHPTLSRPYTSKTLTDLTKQACDIMHKENKALWKVKHLQTRLMGDHTWVPCEMMIGPNDLDLYRDNYVANGVGKLSQSSVRSDASMHLPGNARAERSTTGQISVNGEARGGSSDEIGRDAESSGDVDTSMEDADATNTNDGTAKPPTNGNHDTDSLPRPPPDNDVPEESSIEDTTNNASSKTAGSEYNEAAQDAKKGKRLPDDNEGREIPSTNGTEYSEEQNRDLSNVRALHSTSNGKEVDHGVAGSMSTTSDPIDELLIHPIFLPPRTARPDRDFALPDNEAEDLRRLLQAYIQKQEEVCRGAKRLYEGLLRADRLRKTVFQWSKYEAHCGPNRDMSDGEDWYDKEEWGLDDDLKKGQDEEEEDTTQPAKKTRRRQ